MDRLILAFVLTGMLCLFWSIISKEQDRNRWRASCRERGGLVVRHETEDAYVCLNMKLCEPLE